MGAAIVVGGIVALTLAGTVAPDGGGAVRTVRVALVQGGGQRGLSKEQVSPTTVYAAQVAATSRVASARPPPQLVLWPEDVVALDRPLAGSPQAAFLSRLAEELRTTLVVGVTEPGAGHDVPQRGRRLGAGRPRRGRVREGAPGALRRVRARPLLLLPPGRPLGRADRRRPRARDRAHAHAGRAPRAAGVLRDLLRRPQPLVGASGRGAARRPHEHVVVRHVTGAVAGDRRGDGPGRPDGARSRPGGTHRLQRRRHQPRCRRGAQHAGAAPGAPGHRGAPPRPDALRPLGRPPRPGPLGARARRRLGPPRFDVSRSTPSGCTRRARRPPRTWRGSTGRPRRRAAGRTRGTAGPRRRPA